MNIVIMYDDIYQEYKSKLIVVPCISNKYPNVIQKHM